MKKAQENGSRKRIAEQQQTDLVTKRSRFELQERELLRDADKMADEAEASADITLIVKSNALRRAAHEKRQQIDDLSSQIDGKA